MQQWFLWTCPLPRLIWRVTFCKSACSLGRISSTFTRKVRLPWTCVWFSCLPSLLSPYVTRKDQMLLVMRKLHTARKRVRRDLVPTLRPEFLRKLIPRNTATFARSMGAGTRLVSRKTERKTRFPHRQERWKETQSHKAVFRAFEQEIGLLKVIKKKDTKKQKHCCSNTDSDSE